MDLVLMNEECLESWKDFLIALKERLDKKGKVDKSVLEKIDGKDLNEAIDILKTYANNNALRLDKELIEKLRTITYYTYCEKEWDVHGDKYTKTKEEYLKKPTGFDNNMCLGFVSSQIHNVGLDPWFSAYEEFSPAQVVISSNDGTHNNSSFSNYSDLDENVDFFVSLYGNLYYVDKNSIKNLIDEMVKESIASKKLKTIYDEVFNSASKINIKI